MPSFISRILYSGQLLHASANEYFMLIIKFLEVNNDAKYRMYREINKVCTHLSSGIRATYTKCMLNFLAAASDELCYFGGSYRTDVRR